VHEDRKLHLVFVFLDVGLKKLMDLHTALCEGWHCLPPAGLCSASNLLGLNARKLCFKIKALVAQLAYICSERCCLALCIVPNALLVMQHIAIF